MLTNVTIKAISQYGNIKLEEGNDKWINGESPEVKNLIKQNFKPGDRVNITLSQDNRIVTIEHLTDEQKTNITEKENTQTNTISFKEATLIRQNACRHAASMIDVLQRQGEFDTHPPRVIKQAFFEFAHEVEEWITREKND